MYADVAITQHGREQAFAGDSGPGFAHRSARRVALDDQRRRDLAALILRHQSYLAGLARRLCRNQLDPGDLVHDVFEKAMRAFPLPGGVNERAWLTRVLHNLFVDKLRRRAARREEPLDDELDVAPEPIEPAPWWWVVTFEQIQSTLSRLPAEQRETFELFVLEGRSYEDIAAALDIAKATVGTRMLRARQKLRELLTVEHCDVAARSASTAVAAR